MSDGLKDLFRDLPDYLGGHLYLSLIALAVGLVASVPLGVYAARKPRLAEPLLGLAGVIQTVPSLALLALMVPLLGGRVGGLPAFLALVLYSILPILANTVLGLKGVDPGVVRAGRGLGMTDRQLLRMVELPLALPVIIGGIRTATVLVIGTATLATPVGAATLGNYIFEGLETRNYLSTVFGCVCAAVLAVALDQLIRQLEVAAATRSRARAYAAGVGLALVVLGGLVYPIKRVLFRPDAVVASGSFTEQYILSDLLSEHLNQRGLPSVRQRKGMSEGIQFDSLRAGQIDCYVSYTGNIWTTIMHRTDTPDRATMLAEIREYLKPYGIVCLEPLGFEDAYAMAMRKDRAAELKVKTIAELKRVAPGLKLAADLQFFGRPEWSRLRDPADGYGLTFGEVRSLDQNFTYGAVRDGAVDVIVAYTSDGRIDKYNLLILRDEPLHVFPNYDAIILVSPRVDNEGKLMAALQELSGRISMDLMRQANLAVDVDNKRTRDAASELLKQALKEP
jgi:osmoprotectant transport system permease protein